MKGRRVEVVLFISVLAIPGCLLGDCGGRQCAGEGEACGSGRECCDAEAYCYEGGEPAVCRVAEFLACMPGERCLTSSGTPGVCARTSDGEFGCFELCGRLADFCAAGRCYSSGQPSEFACMPEGDSTAGGRCYAINGCAGALPCLDAGKGAICWTPCESGAACLEDQQCTDTGYGFGVCFAPYQSGCAAPWESCEASACCRGLVCDFDSVTCVPGESRLGDPCRDSSGCSAGSTCFDASGSFEPGYCTSACSADFDCVPPAGVACCNDGFCQFVAGGTCGGREGDMGAGCVSGGGSDCQSGLHCEGGRAAGGLFEPGAFCTRYCSADADCEAAGAVCRRIEESGPMVCTPAPAIPCLACATDADCGNPAENFCTEAPNGGRVCGTPCDPFEPGSCPANFECASVLEDGNFRGFNCTPTGPCE